MADCEMVYALKRFIVEVHKQNGEEYPAETLYELVICLQMFLNSKGKNDYVEVHNCLDNRMKELSCNGFVQKCQKADIVTLDDKSMMWEKKVLGSSNPNQLIDTILYLFRVHFALRPSVEHRSL